MTSSQWVNTVNKEHYGKSPQNQHQCCEGGHLYQICGLYVKTHH